MTSRYTTMMLSCNIWVTFLLLARIHLIPALKYRESMLLCPPHPAYCMIDIDSPRRIYKTIHNTFIVNDVSVDLSTIDDKVFVVRCEETTLAIDDASLPKFDPALSFESIMIEDCAPPNDSYATAFDALNVTGFSHLTLSFIVLNQEALVSSHQFVGLDNVQTLKIECVMFQLRYLDLDFLENLQDLKDLELGSVTVPPFPPWNQLRSITISGCIPLDKLQPWGGCDHLEDLVIKHWHTKFPIVMTELPEKWFANCTLLTSLHIENLIISNLPRQMVNSSFLRTLRVIDCQLEQLAKSSFENVRYLRILDVSHNNLVYIERDTFSLMTNLQQLILTYNLLTVQSLASFAPLVFLRELFLIGNFNEDTCEMSDEHNVTNPWPLLPSLEMLSLVDTGATKLCMEWSLSMPILKYLNLTQNLVAKLQYKDIKAIRNNSWKVDLHENKLQKILYDENDYRAHLDSSMAINYTGSTNATIWIDRFPRVCDCHWYWFARAMQERPGIVLIPDLVCDQSSAKYVNSVPIENMSPESFVCDIKCDRGCKCNRRAHDGTAVAECNSAGLMQMPHVPSLREIHVAHNHIDMLQITDFPETLEYLDLRHNQLTIVDAEIASVMFRRANAFYRLEGNPIICACYNSAFIKALKTYQNQVLDYENVTCKYGQLIKYNTDSLCVKEQMLAIGIVLCCVSLVPFIISILYYQYQNEIRIILYAWGWCACCVNEQELDKDKTYDVFISFAYDDSPYVMNELLPTLELQPHAFTVCVHYRDWMPGEWIPTQIAESVEQSRRTIIVLSKNFLSSIWSLLEFRTAHTQALKDSRVRLIIVLLDDVNGDERMDDELRAYLSTNTYIRRGDPRFWDKLRYALPHRRRDERRLREAGEAVVRRTRPSDPPAALRARAALEMLAEGPTHDIEKQEVSIL